MTCKITVSDGVAPDAVMENLPSMTFGYATLAGGQTIQRFIDGSANMYQRWRKEGYTLAAQNRVPAGLRALDYSRLLTVTVESGLGVDVYTGYSLGPTEDWDFGAGQISWSLTLEAD